MDFDLRKFFQHGQIYSAYLLTLLIFSGCTTQEVVVKGQYPEPVVHKSPIKLGVIYPPEFSNHEIFDEAKTKQDSDWTVSTGSAQVEFWTILLRGLFSELIVISDATDLATHGSALDAVLIPTILDLQYTTPRQTNVKIYELWMRYKFALARPQQISEDSDGNLFADRVDYLASWTISAYGKTPTARLQSDEDAVNLAAVVALRDAGAHFVTFNQQDPKMPCATWGACERVWQDLLNYPDSAAQLEND